MNRFYEETHGIYRLKIPFEQIYTSVFLIKTNRGAMLVDFGSSEDDVENYITPAIKDARLDYSDIVALILTHNHSDHSGGLEKIKNLAKIAKLITTECTLSEEISTYALPGHTEDSIGVFDRRTRTLITGDGLQGDGIDIYRGGIQNPEAYRETLKKAENEKFENLLFSHAYEPWKKDGIFGRKNVLFCICECLKYVK